MLLRRLALFGLTLALAASVAADKPQTWLALRSPHFLVITNAGAKQAQSTADQFEQFRAVFKQFLPKLRVDSGKPIIILCVKDEKSLRALLPAYWEIKGHMHPAGIFISGPEKSYVALRLDAESETPYHVIYHEYVHHLVRLNFTRIPLWLNEGLAEFYGQALLGKDEVGLGRPSSSHLELLKENKLIPLPALLTADEKSPYYNEEQKASIFYAQSWALTHYFLIGDKKLHTKQLSQYLDLLQKNVSEVDAAQQAFGDLRKFQRGIENYIQLASFYYWKLKPPSTVTEKDFQIRELTPAEAAAYRGDFHVHNNRPVEARALLSEALQLDPKLALAQECMGMLSMREGKFEDAREWFERAIANDSKSFLAYYHEAMLASKGVVSPGEMDHAEKALRRAIELNPEFAPAYSMLGFFGMAHSGNLDEALQFARRAAELEPGELQYQLTVASILLRMGKMDDAQSLAAQILAAARNDRDRAMATQFLSSLAQYQQLGGVQRQSEEREETAPDKEQSDTKQPGAQQSESGQKPEPVVTESVADTRAVQPESTPTAPGEGMASAVTCRGKAMDITLAIESLRFYVHSEDYSRLTFKLGRRNPPETFNPCVHLKGHYLKVEYHVVTGKPYAGELVSVVVDK